MKAQGQFIEIEIDEQETHNGIELTEESKLGMPEYKTPQSIVKSIGDRVTQVKEGDRIICERNRIFYLGEMRFVKERDVLGTL